MIEDFINAIQNFRRQKVRTFLSLLGVIIGVASVIVITSMGESASHKIQDTFGSAGLDVVRVSSGFASRRGRSSGLLQFNETFRENLFDNILNIKKIWYNNSLNATLSYGEISVNGSCDAIETGYLEIYPMELDGGAFFSVTDNVYGTQKIILGKNIADYLFPSGDGVGKTILVTADKISFAFTVIGVLKEQNTGIENSVNNAYIPRGFYSKKIKPNPNADTIIVQAMSKEKSTQIAKDIEAYCNDLTGIEYSVFTMSMQTMIEQMNEVTTMLSMLLSAIAAISLLVGGIGIMNIMIVTVTERRHEIGIRKALGAKQSDIRRQFLVESAAITIIGGILGIFIGIAISVAIQFVKGEAYAINFFACVIAFVFSAFVGIFFGLNPASRAAKLDPVLALAGE